MWSTLVPSSLLQSSVPLQHSLSYSDRRALPESRTKCRKTSRCHCFLTVCCSAACYQGLRTCLEGRRDDVGHGVLVRPNRRIKRGREAPHDNRFLMRKSSFAGATKGMSSQSRQLTSVPSWTSCCRTPASSTCTSKTSVRRTCATASRTRWTPLFLDRASSQKASHSGWRVEGAAELKSSRCGTTVVAPPGLRGRASRHLPTGWRWRYTKFGFMPHGYAKLARGPEDEAGKAFSRTLTSGG